MKTLKLAAVRLFDARTGDMLDGPVSADLAAVCDIDPEGKARAVRGDDGVWHHADVACVRGRAHTLVWCEARNPGLDSLALVRGAL